MTTPHDRLRRLEAAMPAPATDARLDLDVFTPGEIRTMEAVAARHPAGAFGRGGGLADLSDDDVAALAAIAARVKTRREEQEATTT